MGVSAIIPLAVAAAGSAAEYANQNKTNHERQAALAAALGRQHELQDQAQRRAHNLVNKVQTVENTDYAQPVNETLMNLLRKPNARVDDNFQQVGNTSGAYGQAAGTAKQGAENYAGNLANYVATAGAPSRQAFARGLAEDNYGDQLGLLKQQMNDQNFLTRLQLEGIQPDPWVGALAGLAQGAANSYFAPMGESYADWLKRQKRNSPYVSGNGTAGWNIG